MTTFSASEKGLGSSAGTSDQRASVTELAVIGL